MINTQHRPKVQKSKPTLSFLYEGRSCGSNRSNRKECISIRKPQLYLECIELRRAVQGRRATLASLELTEPRTDPSSAPGSAVPAVQDPCYRHQHLHPSWAPPQGPRRGPRAAWAPYPARTGGAFPGEPCQPCQACPAVGRSTTRTEQ